MHFEHSQERRMLAQSLSRYIEAHYSGGVERFSPLAPNESRLLEHWRQFADLGAIGALFDPNDGGYGGAAFDIMVVFEALGGGLVAAPFLASLMAGRVLSACGGDKARTLIEGLIEGRSLVTLAHCEPDGSWQPARVGVRARRRNHGWVLDGVKAAVPYGAQADWIVVSARTAGTDTDDAGISLFLVPKEVPGLTVHEYPAIDGERSAELRLQGLELGPDALLGTQDQGLLALEQGIGCGVMAVCAEAVGAMDVVLSSTLDYLKTRRQFDTVIGHFQALQHRMADMMIAVEQSRSAVINAAAHFGAGRLLREKHLCAAKFTVGTAATRIAQECIQMHGGMGMTWELPVSHYATWLAMANFRLGDEDSHLSRYVALARQQAWPRAYPRSPAKKASAFSCRPSM
ncbi:pimeloyl-CoA dehydrogenase small subunit [Bordetella petrii]|nr:pimeloyl-CoA dehydrogenase small subunit [Bordetella petrii]